MATKRQIEANRKNAKRSTGPQTAAGKERSSRNALRHGLARSRQYSDEETRNLVRSIAGAVGAREVSQEISDFAHSKLRLMEIRAVRHAMLAELMSAPFTADIKALRNLERYERSALTSQRQALRLLSGKRI